MSDEKKGRGRTHLHFAVLSAILEKGMLVPDAFEIVDVRYTPTLFSGATPTDLLVVYLESTHIPPVEEGEPLPELSLYYVKDNDQTFLDRIELSGYAYTESVCVKNSGAEVIYKREEVGHD